MAYAVKYVFTFQSVGGTTREIRILKDGYSGDPIRRALGRAPILKKQQNGPVHGTSLEMYAECHVDQEFIEFYTSDPKEYRVDLYAGNALLWQGWITPELYSEPDIAPPYDVQVIATDGVGELKLYDFAAQGMVSLRAMLTYLLGKTGLSTDVFLVSSLKAGSAGAGALLDMEANFDYLVGKTCYEALSYLLTTLHATITWWGGHWLLARENNVTFTSGKVRYFNTAGNSALLANSVQELGSMYQDPAWPVGQLSTVIDPAKNKIVVQAPWHPVTALKNSDMTQDSDWGKILVTYDSTKGAYFFPQDVFVAGNLYQGVDFGGLRVPLRLVLSGCGTSEAGSGFFGRGNGWLSLVLRYTDGSNNVYYLGTDGDGNRRWEQATPGQDPVRAFKQDLLSVDVDRENADRIELDIPALAVGGTFPAGRLAVNIYGGAAYLFSAHLDVILNKGYQDILHIDNGARGEGDDTEVAIGRVTSDIAYYQAFVQGILLNDGDLITSFSDANFTTGMDFLSFISRDYARSVALPRARVEGTVSLEASVQLPPLVFTKGGLDYWLETWSWNLYEDELQISARTLPTATLTVESETITEAGGTASTGSSSGGASSTPSVGLNYFEPNEDRASLVQLKPAYDYLGPRKGLIFGETVEADVENSPAHLMLRNFGTAQNPKYALYTPFALVTGGDQIVINGEPGGGGGGGVMYLSELLDVSLANLAGGQVLSYDSTAQVWKNRTLGDAADYGVTNVVTAGDTTHLVTGAAVATAVAAVLKWKGITTTDIAANPSANPIIINGQSYTAVMGDVVVLSGTSTEYLYNGSTWEPMGDEASYALKTVTITGTGYLTGGGTLEANRMLDIATSVKTKIDNGAAAYGYFSGGVLDTSHLPAFYLGTTRIQTASAQQDVTGIGDLTMGYNKYLKMLDDEDHAVNVARLYKTGSTRVIAIGEGSVGADKLTILRGGYELRFQTGRSSATTHLSLTEGSTGSKSARLYGNLVMNNAAALYFYNYPAEGAQAQSFRAVYATTGNILYFGDGTIGKDYQTRVYGSPLAFYTGSSSVSAANRLTITADGIIRPYVDIVPNTNNAIDLGSATRFFAEAYAKKIYLASGIYLEYNATDGYVYINAPLVTNGDQIVVSGTPGGGGGGGSQYLWELLDVDSALVSPTNGDVLQYNSTDGKWVGVASDTIGITTPGTVAELNAANPTTAKRVWSPSVLASWLAGKGFLTSAVTNVAVGDSGHTDELAITKGGVTSYLTVPYATNVVRFKRYDGTAENGGYDLNTLLSGGGITSQYSSVYYWANAPANMSYGGAVQVNTQASNSLAMQFAWDVVHNQTQGVYGTGKLWWRDATFHDGAADWGAWRLIYDDTTLTKSVITGLLDAGNGTYLPLSGGTMSGNITIPNGNAILAASSNSMLAVNSLGTTFYCGPGYEISSAFLLRSGNINLVHRKFTAASTYNDYAIWDSANANLSTVDWACKDLNAAGKVNVGAPSFSDGALNVNGAIVSSGDQVITSDIRVKRNLKPIDLSVEQIASCRAVSFDWAAGGHSFGSVAQDWEPLVPEAVKQGDIKTLAYGQAALVAAINIAKHDTKQDEEIRQLREELAASKKEIKWLKAEVKRLRS